MKSIPALLLLAGLCAGCERSPGPSTEPPVVASDPVAPGPATPEATPETAPAAPAPPTDQEQALALLTTVEALGQLHRDHADDCGALARQLPPFAEANAAALREASPEAHAWIDGHDALRERMRTAMGEVMTASMGCRDDAEFAAVQRTLFEADGAQPASD